MRHRLRSDDAGVSMIETVVAFVLFGALSSVVAGLLLNVQGVTRSNTQRVAATNLAAAQVELLRSSGTLALADGRTTLGTQVVGGTTYTLVQDVRFVSGPDGKSACAGAGDTLAYKLVTVEVTWPGMGRVRPVRSDTLRTVGLGKTAADVTKGTAAVQVLGAAGQPRSGVLVTLSPTGSTATTGADGCVVFPNLSTATTHTAAVDQFPWVGRQGAQRRTASITVAAGKVTKSSFSYEPRGALAVTTTSPTGFAPPATLAVSLDSTILTPTSTRAYPDCGSVSTAPQDCVSGSPRTAAALFPADYTAWTGTCARPADAPTVTVRSGTTASVTRNLAGLRLLLRADDPLAAGDVYAFRKSATGCTGTESYRMDAPSSSERRLALPPGTWDVAMRADGSDIGTYGVPTQTLTAGAVTTVQR